ncbi:iron-sulfur cluster assembly accessory protein [Buchnera aphidicola (Aphis craccivora)]|uniref:Iron-sulfur cluster assembly 1 homolog, mitochondrial n=2 Tax=cellular organisms TaxID=131567 RepID=A0A6G0WQY3_APHCR|nr:iron-sulfur cluster assembly accessory protein [Buchnera aphidicola]KAF0729819.1 iron-sulfur cluster assembly 1, mitochondrial [Aphis craccivora]QCI16383.1 iron-sulfur cluster assembly accessory protein [Buchnera aphidicola (Aphis craccivora)]QLL40525.1 iron-sulfur cluster assembly accessory protein [Buchnera aphidicola (Aphis craccivore)]WAI17895.1 MAG: iron-sulfur cluster assembly accessory protein [Buchnera aphidicola (Aphis craccivora)]
MKKKQENTYLFNQHKWKGIKITKSAIKQILFLMNLNTENQGIKLSIKKSGCAGFRYIMEFFNTKKTPEKEDNIIFFYENILIQVSKKDIPFLDGVKIDFIKNNINQVFKFNNPKLEKFCGCGESFAIND